MNRLIILGNGFDLAHDLPTSFSQFVLDYINTAWAKFKVDASNTEFELFSIRKPIVRKKLPSSFESIKEFVYFKELLAINIISKNYIFQHILSTNMDLRWVDFEMSYYALLTRVLSGGTFIEYRNLNPEGVNYVDKLNEDLESIKNVFLTFLAEKVVDQKMRTLNRQFIDFFGTHEFDNNVKYQKSIILNFNYTDTIQNYLLAMSDPNDQRFVQGEIDLNRYSLINIHGSLHDPGNPIIFGFGDELDRSYTQLENLNYNGLLKNAKSFGYFNNHNFDRLQLHINEQPFDIYIIGHSCGLSDRTLLNQLFESNHCNQVSIFYHKSKQNYYEITYEISRHFTDKQLLRKKVLNFEYAGRCPQNNDENVSRVEFPKYSLKKVLAINNQRPIDWSVYD